MTVMYVMIWRNASKRLLDAYVTFLHYYEYIITILILPILQSIFCIYKSIILAFHPETFMAHLYNTLV